jgi:hypothetical protein
MTQSIHTATIFEELFDDYEKEVRIDVTAYFYPPSRPYYADGDMPSDDGGWEITEVFLDGDPAEIEDIAPKLLTWNKLNEQRMTADELTYKLIYALSNPIELPF